MIRRSPTRIELKLDDLHDFEYINKFEKKKSTVISNLQQHEKLARHERIAGVAGGSHPPARTASTHGGGPAGRAAASAAAATSIHPPVAHSGGAAANTSATDSTARDSSISGVREEGVWVGEWTPEERAIPPYIANQVSGPRRRHNAATASASIVNMNRDAGSHATSITTIPLELEDEAGGDPSSINNSTMMSLDESL